MDKGIGDLVIKTFISSFISVVISIWPILVLFLLCTVILVFYQQYRYRKSDIYAIDKMSGSDFEQFLMSLFQRLGYKAEHIGKLGDFGGDLIIEKDGVKTLVQAKRLSSNVKESAVQQAIAAKENYKCDKAMVVTNQFFWNHAWMLAKNTDVTLWTRNDLINKMNEAIRYEKNGDMLSLRK